VICLQVDVSSEAEVKNAIEYVSEHFGKLNITFSNAGVLAGGGPIREIDTAEWGRVFRINFFAMLYCSKYAVQEMAKSGKPGPLVMTSSVGGMVSTAGGFSYTCAKAAIITLAKCIACEYSNTGVRANVI